MDYDDKIEYSKWQFRYPMFCIEYPGVGVFHDPWDFECVFSAEDPAFPRGCFVLNLLMNLHPYIRRARQAYLFRADVEVFDNGGWWTTSLALLATSGRLVAT